MSRRELELIVVVVTLMTPVLRMGRIWTAKHIATSNNPATKTAAEVAHEVL